MVDGSGLTVIGEYLEENFHSLSNLSHEEGIISISFQTSSGLSVTFKRFMVTWLLKDLWEKLRERMDSNLQVSRDFFDGEEDFKVLPSKTTNSKREMQQWLLSETKVPREDLVRMKF